MPFPSDGVYTIRNVGRGLMLDLRGNSTAEGNQIQGYANNGTVAQQWVIKRQNPPGIQSNNDGNNGNGFFATASEDSDELVVYTRQAFVVDLVGRPDDYYSIRYTLGNENLMLSIPGSKHNEVKLENYDIESTRQQWQFVRVSDLQPLIG
ncbi:uncharacterized protein BJ212DRAFT_1371457 [Suillus subaureus]|uniref:Ricin B lectin domain-containing protein n=1 Tax=Suillus subaureus TaxID=48587 RepID=A0A9P7E5T3_9AGAM|nr:uncharacterized protein BJ212DRAFT_1371457 [Suillus subaureus]KAG1812110.1 hypothetical protein BJ212DRAFT_1371457 [Suillus subaureus]